MSELNSERRRSRDAGTTLPELLVTIMLLGLVVTSLSAALIVIFRQQDNTTGRLNVARAEQNIGLWLPADLASAELVDVSAGAHPCAGACPAGTETGGSNTLMLSWDSLEPGATSPIASTTNVSYRYVETGGEYRLVRVACTSVAGGAWTCRNSNILSGLDAPPPGTTWVPGVTQPTWVIQVSEPLDPADPSGPGNTIPVDPSAPTKNAKRVVVTVDGGGDAVGAGGGVNIISLSAGGTVRNVIDSTSTAGTPSFNEARTRCGGTYGLIIDDSGSIGSAMGAVRTGVIQFINAFAGTPVKLQVVRFDTTASVLGQNPRTRYFDMLNPADVGELRTAVGTLAANGATNWEDALHRMFFDQNGAILQVVPDKVLFFTDGEPTWNRVDNTSTASAPITPPERTPLLALPSSVYDQEAFNRAKFITDRFRADVDFIGVGVGPAFTRNSNWLDIGPGWHYNYERGFHYEKRNSSWSSWYTVNQAGYDATSPTTNRRIAYTSPYSFWEPTTQATYNTLSSSARRRIKDYTPPFDNYDVLTTSTPNRTILSRLIAGNDMGVVAESVNGRYINADVANMYVLPDFNQFAGALEAVALAECGGTLTMQTKVGAVAAADPFTYQHSASSSSGGLPLQATMDVVTTTRSFASGTFDFSIPNGEFITVEIRPVDMSGLTRYTPIGWACTAGGAAKTIQTFPITGSPWTGIRVQVRANEAVSCVQTVNRT